MTNSVYWGPQMESAFDIYRSSMRESYGPAWSVHWPLMERFSVGQIYTQDRDQLLHVGNFSASKLPPVSDPVGRDSWTYDSGGATEVIFKPSGKSVAGFSVGRAEAAALVKFSRERTVFATFRNVSYHGVIETGLLADEIIRQCHEGSWDKDLILVTHVATAQSGTVLISAGKEAVAELRMSAASNLGLVHADLTSGVELFRSHNISAKWVGGGECTPFFKVVRVKKSVFGKLRIEYGRSASRGPGGRKSGRTPPPDGNALLREAEESPSSILEEFVL